MLWKEWKSWVGAKLEMYILWPLPPILKKIREKQILSCFYWESIEGIGLALSCKNLNHGQQMNETALSELCLGTPLDLWMEILLALCWRSNSMCFSDNSGELKYKATCIERLTFKRTGHFKCDTSVAYKTCQGNSFCYHRLVKGLSSSSKTVKTRKD